MIRLWAWRTPQILSNFGLCCSSLCPLSIQQLHAASSNIFILYISLWLKYCWKMGDMNFSLTTFNKTGKLMQIEYALARVQQGKMALGIKGKWTSSRYKNNLCFVYLTFTNCDFSMQREMASLSHPIRKFLLFSLTMKNFKKFRTLPPLQVFNAYYIYNCKPHWFLTLKWKYPCVCR